jgi:hypothetical protein
MDGMEKVLMGLTDLKQVRSVHQVTAKRHCKWRATCLRTFRMFS